MGTKRHFISRLRVMLAEEVPWTETTHGACFKQDTVRLECVDTCPELFPLAPAEARMD